MLLLALASGSALAEWVEFARNDDFTGYVDSSNASGVDETVKVWSLLDYRTTKTNAGRKFQSVKARYEYDCGKKQSRKLFSSIHSENMGEGEVVDSSYKVGNWEPILPHSILEAVWKIACTK